jgi:hypothetical protein
LHGLRIFQRRELQALRMRGASIEKMAEQAAMGDGALSEELPELVTTE